MVVFLDFDKTELSRCFPGTVTCVLDQESLCEALNYPGAHVCIAPQDESKALFGDRMGLVMEVLERMRPSLITFCGSTAVFGMHQCGATEDVAPEPDTEEGRRWMHWEERLGELSGSVRILRLSSLLMKHTFIQEAIETGWVRSSLEEQHQWISIPRVADAVRESWSRTHRICHCTGAPVTLREVFQACAGFPIASGHRMARLCTDIRSQKVGYWMDKEMVLLAWTLMRERVEE